jgi:hypothetical protein
MIKKTLMLAAVLLIWQNKIKNDLCFCTVYWLSQKEPAIKEHEDQRGVQHR